MFKIPENKTFICVLFFVFLALISIPLFIQLDELPIRMFDEARQAEAAYEMYNSGNWLIPTHQGEPEMWSTKPPFLIWLQVICIYIFGQGELATRFPVALCAIFTCLALVYFSKKFFDSYLMGILSGLVLITSYGYMSAHGARTGDYDVPLTLFTTVYIFSFWQYIKENNIKYLYFFSLSITLAILTKGIAAFLFVPVLAITALVSGKLKQNFLSKKTFYWNVLGIVLVSAGYYLAREHYSPGFLKAVSANELGGRYLMANEGHEEETWFYFHNLLKYRFNYWYYLVPVGIAAGLILGSKPEKKFIAYIFSCSLFFFFVITLAKTKLQWYDIPMLPLLSMLVAYTLYYAGTLFYRLNQSFNFKFNATYLFIFFLLFLGPYRKIINQVYPQKELDVNDENHYRLSNYLRDALQKGKKIDSLSIVFEGYKTHLIYYSNLLNDQGSSTGFKALNDLKEGDWFVATQDEMKKKIEKKFGIYPTENLYNMSFYRLNQANSKLNCQSKELTLDFENPKPTGNLILEKLEIPEFISDKKSFSGKSGLKISKETSYALDLKLKLKKNASYEISCFMYPAYKGGVLVASTKNTANLYLNAETEEQINGWDKKVIYLKAPENLADSIISIYLWNNNNTDFFVDDVLIKECTR